MSRSAIRLPICSLRMKRSAFAALKRIFWRFCTAARIRARLLNSYALISKSAGKTPPRSAITITICLCLPPQVCRWQWAMPPKRLKIWQKRLPKLTKMTALPCCLHSFKHNLLVKLHKSPLLAAPFEQLLVDY